MKVQVLRVLPLSRSVSFLEPAVVDIPLREVLLRGLCGLYFGPLDRNQPRRFWNRERPRWVYGIHVPPGLIDFGRGPRTGYLMYGCPEEFVDFLLRRYRPSGRYLIDSVLRNGRRNGARAERARMALSYFELRNKRPWDWDDDDSESGDPLFPAFWDRDVLLPHRKDGMFDLETPQGRVLVGSTDEPVIVGIGRTRRVGAHRIPRCEYVIVFKKNASYVLRCGDEVRFGRIEWPPTDEFLTAAFGAAFFRALETTGRMLYPTPYDDLLPDPAFRPFAVVRVPVRAPRRIGPPPAEAAGPLILRGAQFVGELPRDLPVFSAPAQAAAILARAAGGVYHPQEQPIAPVRWPDEQTRWLVAGTVRP